MKNFYPDTLEPIMQKLIKEGIKPIIVGGVIRDAILGFISKDIDIELHNLSSLEILDSLLKEFGKLNSVGKSFGVYKLKYESYDIDFSLPRTESKISTGHKGFEVTTHTHISFKDASRRRDFTINSLGYDVKNKRVLDPFNGIKDLEKRVLRVVDEKRFIEDPLRILRAMQFSARFELFIEKNLLKLTTKMVEEGALQELPQERIFEEFKKLFLKAKKVSTGIKFFKEIGGFSLFKELYLIQEYKRVYSAIDTLKERELDIVLTLLLFELSSKDVNSFLKKFTNNKELIKSVSLLHKYRKSFQEEREYTESELYTIAQHTPLKKLITLSSSYYQRDLESLVKKASKLHIYTQKLTPIIQGRDLIALGLKPSPNFKSLLAKAYNAQIKGRFSTHEEGLKWLSESINIA